VAIVLTSFTPTLTRQPFVKPPDTQRQFTAMPRALLFFVLNAGVVPLKPLNDQQKVQFIMTLPTTFAYRMVYAAANIQSNKSDEWGTSGELQVTNAIRGQPLGVTTRHTVTSDDGTTFSTITGNRNYFMRQIPTFIMQSLRANVGAGADFRIGNDSASASTAGVANFLAYFFEYDIEQVQGFPPLIPQLTYATA